MKETRNEDVISLYGLVGSQTISFSVPHFLFFINGLLWRKSKSLWWSKLLSRFLSMPQPAATLQPLLRETCWMHGHDPFLPFMLWVAFLPPWLVTPPLLGLGNLVWRMQRQKPWKLPANEDSGRQGCLSLARSLGQRGCMGERHAQHALVSVGRARHRGCAGAHGAREWRPRSHKECPKPSFWSAVKYLTVKAHENANNGDITYLFSTSYICYILEWEVSTS